MRRREAAQAEQRRRNRNAALLGKVAEHVHGAGNNHAVAGQDHGPLCAVDQLERLIVIRGLRRKVRTISRQLRRRRFPLELAGALLRVLGDVDQHRPRPPRGRDVERFANGARDFVRARDQVIVLGDRQGDAGDVGFLEGVVADELAAYLPGDAHDGRGIHHRRGNAGDHVGRPGTGGGNGNAHATAGPRIAIGHVRGALLVPHQYVVDGITRHRVIRGQNRSAGIAEDVLHALAHQAFPNDLAAGLGHGCHLHSVPHRGLARKDAD